MKVLLANLTWRLIGPDPEVSNSWEHDKTSRCVLRLFRYSLDPRHYVVIVPVNNSLELRLVHETNFQELT